MRLNLSTSRPSPRAFQSGVALIVTVIMISVITFLTVAFLALSGREKNSVKIATAQTTARLAADEASARAQTEILAGIMTAGNIANFDLLVSTNYVNWNGFDPAAVDRTTNVNYDYRSIGGALTIPDAQQNIANLLYSPRPPVYVVTNLLTGESEFRFYIDLNRNRRHERSGYWPVISPDLVNPYYNTNGATMPAIVDGNTLSNYITGDPEWLGGLNRPQQPHSSSNKFLYRYAYLVVPEGKTLDINYIHNQALVPSSGTGRLRQGGQDFFRNQGVGTWEINLAAFLRDLNTNQWDGYAYDPVNAVPTTGTSFGDAGGLYRYRVNGPIAGNINDLNYNLYEFGYLYPASALLFQNDQIDGYSDGNLQTTINFNADLVKDNIKAPWVGANHPFHFFTTQDLFDPKKANRTGGGLKFTDRLYAASTNVSTYDQGTFYRLLSQLGADSATEDDDKLNLNYVNVGGLKVTNFVKWTDSNAITAALGAGVTGSVLFFTNTVDRLLEAYTAEWLAADFAAYTNFFKTDKAFGVSRIPVYVSNQFIYSPAVQRVLQVAANVWDSRANRRDTVGDLPTIFRPLFTVDNGNVYINGFREVTTRASLQTTPRPILDLTVTTNLPSIVAEDIIYGVPLVVGARKGLPNFNEFSMESIFTMTRKLELRKSAVGGADKINQTNQFFTMSLTMPSAAEFWNSYASNYDRKVSVYVTNRTTMSLTNDSGVVVNKTFVTSGFIANPKLGVTFWPNALNQTYSPKLTYQNYENPDSFLVTMRTNVPFLPTQTYLPNRNGNAGFIPTNSGTFYDTSQDLLAPNWGMTITNRISAMIVEQGTDRIIDYVLLGDLTSHRDLSLEFSVPSTGTGDAFDLLWATNRTSSGRTSGRKGVEQQVRISRGGDAAVNVTTDRWKSFGTFDPSDVDNAIAGFNAFFQDDSKLLSKPVPYSATINYAVPMSWQANDPLVHYLGAELFYIAGSGQISKMMPGITASNQLANIGAKNKRYLPWAKIPEALDTDPDAFNFSIKDPLVRSSDDWNFPTNNFATVGWLGQIHRGTPWQTIYLKSSNVGLTNIVNSPTEWANSVVYKPSAEKWANWTGNKTWAEGYYSRPVSDRVLFDVFSAALNENSTRGQLPINQTNLAAWSAVFSGMIALTNSSSEGALLAGFPGQFSPIVIQPAGLYNAFDSTTWSPLVRLVDGINRTRANTNYFANGTFNHMGDILAVPELTDASPFLNLAPGSLAVQRGINDAAYEWLPQQAMSLLQLGKPRFVIYAYGQSLQPAPNSIVTAGGAFFGLCTNYAITAEVATRTVVEIKGTAKAPRVEVKSYNILGPD